MVSSGATVGLGLMGVEGMVMAGEGEGTVGMGVLLDFSAISVVLDDGFFVCVELDDGVTVSVGMDNSNVVSVGLYDGISVSIR